MHCSQAIAQPVRLALQVPRVARVLQVLRVLQVQVLQALLVQPVLPDPLALQVLMALQVQAAELPDLQVQLALQGLQALPA